MKTKISQAKKINICKTYATVYSDGSAKVSLSGFAEACYNDNSEQELLDALAGKADRADCENWGIRPGQWRAAIEEALAAKWIDENDGEMPV